MTWSVGIDIAGYSTGKTGVSAMRRIDSDAIEAYLVRESPFSRKAKGQDRLSAIADLEIEFVGELIKCARVYLDVPIDLQFLVSESSPEYVWELTKRPVDLVFGGLPPLADKIGSPVFRVRNILREFWNEVGVRVFESYPAASIKLVTGEKHSYKNSVIKLGDEADPTNQGLAALIRRFSIQSAASFDFSDDDLDALVCALCGVVPSEHLLYESSLDDYLRRNLPSIPRYARSGDVSLAPAGYVLLTEITSQQVVVREIGSDDFIALLGAP